MTPMLVLIFAVNPQVAIPTIASDLVSSLVMKPVGGSVHARRGSVHWPLVGRLVAGSVPAALAGAYVSTISVTPPASSTPSRNSSDSRSLVGTDLVQAVPLVATATLGQAIWGHVDLGLSDALIIGSIPGVYLGARVSARAPDRVVRPTLAFILVASGLSLLLAGNTNGLALALIIVAVTGLPMWAAVDATLLRLA